MGLLKTIAETAKTVLQASNVGRSSQLFLSWPYHPFNSELGEELVPLGAPRMVAEKKRGFYSFRGRPVRGRGVLCSVTIADKRLAKRNGSHFHPGMNLNLKVLKLPLVP